MNEIINKFLLAGDNFMPEMFLRQFGIIYTACAPVSKNKEYKNLNKQEVQNTFIKRTR